FFVLMIHALVHSLNNILYPEETVYCLGTPAVNLTFKALFDQSSKISCFPKTCKLNHKFWKR
ncbi:hypothetical protein ACJX0J_029339, partial [Zea mays]